MNTTSHKKINIHGINVDTICVHIVDNTKLFLSTDDVKEARENGSSLIIAKQDETHTASDFNQYIDQTRNINPTDQRYIPH